jgi:catechol 2,3-dioxygenase-like lactoylglutathione lyase family enzyme
MFKRIDHLELLTASPERIVAFYTGTLGFRERERTRIPETPQGPLDLVYLELGGTTIEVMCYSQAKSIAPRSAEQMLGWQCLALEVDDMERALAMLRTHGVQAVWGAAEAAGLFPRRDPRPGWQPHRVAAMASRLGLPPDLLGANTPPR